MLELLSHDISLLLQLLDLDFSWSNISFQLFDLVIKYELEFFQLLSFLFQVNDSLVFIFDGGFSFIELTLLTKNLLLKIISALVELTEFFGFLFDTFFFIVTFSFLPLEVIVNKR